MFKSFEFDRIVIERQGIYLLKDRAQVVFDFLVIARMDDQLLTIDDLANLPFLDDDFSALDDVAWITKLQLAVRLVVEECHIGISADAEMSLLRSEEHTSELQSHSF